LEEGVHLQGRLTRRLALLGPDGAVVAESAAVEPIDARVRGVAAMADAGGGRGPLVALTRINRFPATPVRFTDSTGHAHVLSFERGAAGEPPRAIEASIDGRVFARVQLDWQRTGRGFVLTHRGGVFFDRNGRAVAREDVTTDVPQVSTVTTSRLRSLAMNALMPRRLEAEEAWCFVEALYYAGASLAVAIGAFAIVETPWNLKLWGAEIAAIKVWDATLDDLLACLVA